MIILLIAKGRDNPYIYIKTNYDKMGSLVRGVTALRKRKVHGSKEACVLLMG